MGKEKSPKRICEECGRIIESKRPGVVLCHECSEAILSEPRNRDKKRRQERTHAEDFEADPFLRDASVR